MKRGLDRYGIFSVAGVRAGPRHSTSRGADSLRIVAPGRISACVHGPVDAFPCRLSAPDGCEVAQLSFGRASSGLCDALYSPSTDMAVVCEGQGVGLRPVTRDGAATTWTASARGALHLRAVAHHFRDGLGHPRFRPLDRTAFDRAPSGWCSWYIYAKDVSEAKVLRNLRWLARNLVPFGLNVCQVDDGWQGNGYGHGGNRDWFRHCRSRFPHGMKWLAAQIRKAGMMPGIWLIPNTQSDPRLFRRNPAMFVRRPDGRSFNELDAPLPHGYIRGRERYYRWSGRYLLDPTHPDARDYLTRLMATVGADWGYDYIKLDAQGYMVELYTRARDLLHRPQTPPAAAYRLALKAIRRGAGRRRFLLNCTGGWDSGGYCDGIRTGDDVRADASGLATAAAHTYEKLYVNGLAWWADPDVVCVREPLTLEQARAWVTLTALTGQAFLTSDDMPALPRARVALLKRALPVLPIRPMELYPLRQRPSIFDLKTARPGVGAWDVAAVFNWSPRWERAGHVRASDLGLPARRGGYVFFDVWRERLVAMGTDSAPVRVGPQACRVLAVHRLTARPQFLATSRHVTAGAADLVRVRWDARRRALTGTSRLVAGEPYRIHFTVPEGWRAATLAVRVRGRVGTLTLRSRTGGERDWRVEFRLARPRPAAGR